MLPVAYACKQVEQELGRWSVNFETRWEYGIILVVVGATMFAVGMLSDVDESLRVLEPIPPNVIAWAGVLVFAIGWYNFHKNQKTIAKAYKDRDILAKIIDSRQKKD